MENTDRKINEANEKRKNWDDSVFKKVGRGDLLSKGYKMYTGQEPLNWEHVYTNDTAAEHPIVLRQIPPDALDDMDIENNPLPEVDDIVV